MLTPGQIERLVTAAVGLADAKARRHDREPAPCCDAVFPGEYAASPQPPAGTPTGPANADGSFDEPVLRQVWTASTDPDADTTYRLVPVGDEGAYALHPVERAKPRTLRSELNRIIEERRATEDVAATVPTVPPPAIASVNRIAPDANGVVVLAVHSAAAATVTVVATDGTAIGSMASAPTPPSA